MLEAAGTPWGIAGLLSVALAIAAAVALRGRLRLQTGLAALLTAALLLAVASVTPERGGESPEPGGAADPGAEAQALVAAAERVLSRGDAEAAAANFARAGAIYRRQGDVLGEAGVLFGLGRMGHVTGQSDDARAHYDEALALYRRAGDLGSEARVLAARGDLEKDTFNWSEAQRFYRQARGVWAGAPEPKSDPHAVLQMADAPQMPEGEEAARAVLRQAALIFEQIGDLEAGGDAQALSGALNLNLGAAGDAYADHTAAEALYRSAGTLAKAAESALWRARSSIRIGYNASAADALAGAGELYAGLDDVLGTARAALTRGDLERLQGRMMEALAAYAAAATVLRSQGNPEAAAAFLKLGQLEAYLGHADAARAAQDEAAGLSRAAGQVVGEAAARMEQGALARADGDAPAAEAMLGAALELYRAAGDARGEGRALLEQAARHAAGSRLDAGRAAYRESAARFEEAAVPFGHLLAALGLADLEWAAGNTTASADAYRAADGILRAITDPVAEANRLLGLPPVGSLFIAPATVYHADPFEVPDPAAPAAAQAQNLLRFPDHNVEARALVAATMARIAAANAATRGQTQL